MSSRPSKETQIIDRPSLTATAGDPLFGITRLIEQGEEARRVYQTLVESACALGGAQAAALLLASDTTNTTHRLVAQHGSYDFSELEATSQRHERSVLQAAITGYHRSTDGALHHYDVVCLGTAIGSLIVVAPNGLRAEAQDKLTLLAHHAGVVFERQRLSNTLQHMRDRLQVLNEINQLIASNVGLQRIAKGLARESAFRFAADVALTLILNEEKTVLEGKGSYGCAPTLVPKNIPVNGGVLGQAMKVGGHLSIANLENYPQHGLDYLVALDVKSVDVCSLEVRGESLGIIVIGYRSEFTMSPEDLVRFEEFCQGAAVAIANARTQERITAYTERLEELVESRTADLAVQTARAEEANRAKSQFLANMSHELRTPLTAIVGYSSVIADGVFGELNEKQRDALNAITRSSEHLKNLIDEVLNLARIESGKEEAEPARVPLKDLLQQTYKLMLQTAIGKGVTILPLKIHDEVLNTALYVDAKHVHQILINLLSNAVKYTPRGGRVWVEAERVVDKIRIAVFDTGVGIPPHKLEKLFERFERGEDAYSRNQEGTGIGLHLTRKLVELNGGRIGVESVEGEGSQFWILLPLAAAEAQGIAQSDVQEARVNLDGISALVVDDNRDTCEVLRQILLASGAQVRTAESVREGIELLGDATPDIVLTDLAMPGDSGLMLIEHIRNGEAQVATLPVIVLSACAFQADRDAALAAGASLFIPKPFRPNEIVKAVRHLTFSSALKGEGPMSGVVTISPQRSGE